MQPSTSNETLSQSRALDAAGGASASLLRDVAFVTQPRTLTRPGASQSTIATQATATERPREAAVATTTPSPSESMPLASASASNPVLSADDEEALMVAGYRDGFAAGREDGLAAGRREGHELGAQQGYQDGMQRGIQAAREQAANALREEQEAAQRVVAERLAMLDGLLAALPQQITERLDAAEDDMVALCHAVVCRVFGDALVSGQGIAHLVRQAVVTCCGDTAASGGAGGAGLVAVHVHPQELARLQNDPMLAAWLAPRLAASGNADPGALWVADESVGRGGCVVRSSEGSLDARLATQLAALTDWFAGGRRAAAVAPHPTGAPR
ncbi:FliH/SctL family protein [Trinickia fusca]|uniref:Flagellar assembly protein FliH n=1 Tax=Trinickia fusca TaxID=2419777 RepID=A0A494XD43_9BURK|nr:FliH/SctL family protein [Trinickia fusca]RKP48418.1 hypothetical protein D7S89_14015 [Trinickia fusca]